MAIRAVHLLYPLSRAISEMPGVTALLLSTQMPPQLASGDTHKIQWKRILPMGYAEYSLFTTFCLHHFIETDFCLIVQDDGFVLSGERFSPEWLKFDYIGAPTGYAIVNGEHLVGGFRYRFHKPSECVVVQNGGLSLRSKKLLRALSTSGVMYRYPRIPILENEDIQVSGLFRSELEALGFRFADLETASRFSVEHLSDCNFHTDLPLQEVFGTHRPGAKLVRPDCVRFDGGASEVKSVYRQAEIIDLLESVGLCVEFSKR